MSKIKQKLKVFVGSEKNLSCQVVLVNTEMLHVPKEVEGGAGLRAF